MGPVSSSPVRSACLGPCWGGRSGCGRLVTGGRGVIDGAAAAGQAGDDLVVGQGEQLPDLAVRDGGAEREGHPEALVEGPCGAHLAGVGVPQLGDEPGGQLHRHPRTVTEPAGLVERDPREHLPGHLDGEQVLSERVVLHRARKCQGLRDQLVASHRSGFPATQNPLPPGPAIANQRWPPRYASWVAGILTGGCRTSCVCRVHGAWWLRMPRPPRVCQVLPEEPDSLSSDGQACYAARIAE